LSIFAVVAAVAHSGLRSVLDVRQHTEHSARQLGQMQMALALLGRDLEQTVARTVRDQYGDRQAPLRFSPFGDNPRLELLRINGSGELQRVAWEIRDGALYRLYWSVVDGADPEKPQGGLPVIEKSVKAKEQTPFAGGAVRGWKLKFHYRNDEGAFSSATTWPLEINPLELESLPEAVEVTLEFHGGGEVTRWYAML